MNMTTAHRTVGPLTLLWAAALLAAVAGGAGCDGNKKDDLAAIRAENLKQIQSLPYLNWVPVSPGEAQKSGVTILNAARSSAGMNLFNSRPRNVAQLMDATGRVWHTWTAMQGGTEGWHHVEPGSDGALYVVVPEKMLVKIDWNSRVEWVSDVRAHHDLAIHPSGDLYVLTNEIISVPHAGREIPLLADYVAVLTPDGRLRKKFSLWDLFRNRVPAKKLNKIAHMVDRMPDYRSEILTDSLFDILHANSIECIETESHPVFAKGQFLISLLMLNTVAVVDLDRGKVIWRWEHGEVDRQHHATLLPNGNVLLFDNGTHRTYSRILEVDPSNDRVVWSYTAHPRRSLHSRSRGGNQPLPNGNILITESDRGRAFEITTSGQTVWEFFNPDFTVDPSDGILKRAAIYRMRRLDETELGRLGISGRLGTGPAGAPNP